MQVITAPDPFPADLLTSGKPVIFLAGSIEQDKAERWQDKVIATFQDKGVTILNPRRDSWNAEAEQTVNNPDFRLQVNWELDGLSQADIIMMYFAEGTYSPITLLEFGAFYKHPGIEVAAAPTFWRRGNLEVMCERQNIALYSTLDELIEATKKGLGL